MEFFVKFDEIRKKIFRVNNIKNISTYTHATLSKFFSSSAQKTDGDSIMTDVFYYDIQLKKYFYIDSIVLNHSS